MLFDPAKRGRMTDSKLWPWSSCRFCEYGDRRVYRMNPALWPGKRMCVTTGRLLTLQEPERGAPSKSSLAYFSRLEARATPVTPPEIPLTPRFKKLPKRIGFPLPRSKVRVFC
jgi:hypothetical protein